MSLTRFSNKELLTAPNCVALSEVGRCKWMIGLECRGVNCPFQKTTEKLYEEQNQVFQRLANLSKERQEHIARKYYGGQKPWNKG